ncbi:MAG: sodium:calcium antiporter [Candidatus Bathyarchaeota archaeon]|nr:sodium:calcium antiporter [Candidatus Bathyarchaeota archaeon]MCX8177045.1 sodium:calcium antiporter [Candidatus Bathyarchaeota archaeon]MDW8194216.1 sodium:calcium antiporter [Nitrososphaerota archaeon]
MFEEWGLLGSVLIMMVSLFILDRASDIAIDNAVKVSEITGLGKTTVGFILIALVTTLPELSVSVLAAFGKEGMGIAIGNVLGSNIVNIGLILGAGILIAAMKSQDRLKMAPLLAEEEIGTLHFGLFIASMIPLLLIYVGYVSRFIGIILIGIFVYHVYRLSKTKTIREEGALGGERARLKLYVFLTVTGALMVVISANFLVDSAVLIATWLGVPQVVLGATIVAFGTSLPEFANTIKASSKGHVELAMGNLIGSCFTNITLILGVALIGSPLAVNMAAFTNLVVFSLITNLLLWYFLTSGRVSWREGVLLLFMYMIFLIASFGGYRT